MLAEASTFEAGNPILWTRDFIQRVNSRISHQEKMITLLMVIVLTINASSYTIITGYRK